LRVHLDREGFEDSSMANVEKWASEIPVPTYAIDDQTAIKVADGAVEVVSEGHWKLFTPGPDANRLGSGDTPARLSEPSQTSAGS